MKPWFPDSSPLLRQARAAGLVLVPALAVGTASAAFLWALAAVTQLRWDHPWLLFLLPVAGLAVGLVYHWVGQNAEAGTNLILDEIHEPGGGVPARLAPLVLLGTLVTHLCGGSAGREGTAVQMGGSLAATFGRLCRVPPSDWKVLLQAGMAAGFGAVFGTPWAGALFAVEVLTVGRLHLEFAFPVLIASFVGDWTCTAWGIHHPGYHILLAGAGRFAPITPRLVAAAVGAGIFFGLVARLFTGTTHLLQGQFQRVIRWAPLRPVVGGVLVLLLTYAVGTRDYLGIGVTSPDSHGVSIVAAFGAGGLPPLSWLWKLVFTAVTLASGFKGGEVTPLFFIGATLGHVIGTLAGLPVDFLAGLGFLAVFGAAAKTPLTCIVMGLELFGLAHAPYYAVACGVAYVVSGTPGIYRSQRRLT